MTIVKHSHLREMGYCNRGSREWFARNNLSWSDFLRDGLDADFLRTFDDSMVDTVVDRAEAAENGK